MTGGILSEGVLSRGIFSGGFLWLDFFSGGILSGGFYPVTLINAYLHKNRLENIGSCLLRIQLFYLNKKHDQLKIMRQWNIYIR